MSTEERDKEWNRDYDKFYNLYHHWKNTLYVPLEYMATRMADLYKEIRDKDEKQTRK